MSKQDDEMLIQLQQLAKNLSMELAIPLLKNPMDLQFATQCVNAILGSFNSNWKKVHFQPKNEQQFQQCWVKLMKIASQSFLQQDEKIIDQNEDVSIKNVVMLYQVLCQACQALRQQNLSPVLGFANFQENQIPKKNLQKKQNKNKQLQEKKNIQNKKLKSENPRPKTTTNNKKKPLNQVRKLEQQVIENVTKTMQKNYLVKAQAKRQAKIRQKQGTQAVQKAKRTLDYAVKAYQYENKQNAKNKQKLEQKANKKNTVTDPYMKMIQNKHKKLNQQLQSQQLKYYLQLRDKKVAYIRHIHKLIQKLQKQREIQFNKKQREVQNQKKKQMIQKIQNVDNLFKLNMEKLQQNYQKKKNIQQLQNVGQIQVCRAMQKTIKQKKFKQMEDMKCLWAEQRNQLHKITTDQQKMKNKLIQIYRKYRV